jgi:hypothetical protein
LKFDPGKLWISVLAPAAVMLGLPIIIFSIKHGLGVLVTVGYIIIIFGSLMTALIVIPLALGIHYLALAIYLAATVPVRHSTVSLRSYFSASWRNCAFRDHFLSRLKFSGKYLLWGLAGLSPIILYKGISLLNDVSRLPFSLPLNLLILLTAFALVSATLVALVRRQLRVIPTVLTYIFGGVAVIAAAVGAVYLFVKIWGWVIDKLNQWTLPISALLVKLLVGLIVMALAGGLIYSVWLFRRKFQILIVWRRHAGGLAAVPPVQWKDQIMKADPDLQLVLLTQTTHQTLGLNAEQFLKILEDIQDLIKDEPALSGYWEKRDRLEQVLRQERIG